MHEGFTVNLRAEKMLTQAIHQYNKKNVEYDYTHVYILSTKILQWGSCSTIYAKM